MSQQLTLDAAIARVSQKRQVLALLRMAGDSGVCIANMPMDLAYAGRNRIGELRREGYSIDSATCHVHNHRAAVARYVLTGEPA